MRYYARSVRTAVNTALEKLKLINFEAYKQEKQLDKNDLKREKTGQIIQSDN